MSEPTITEAADAVESAWQASKAWAERAQMTAKDGKQRADLPQVVAQLPALEKAVKWLRWLERNEAARRRLFELRHG